MQKVTYSAYELLPAYFFLFSLAIKDRKYFDSGDYALSKAGVAPQNAVGTAIPNPEK